MGRFDKIFEIQEELEKDIPKLTILNFDRVYIENYVCILEYQDYFIKIKMKNGIVNINGIKLLMNEMTKEDLIITGTIDSIEFEKFKE